MKVMKFNCIVFDYRHSHEVKIYAWKTYEVFGEHMSGYKSNGKWEIFLDKRIYESGKGWATIEHMYKCIYYKLFGFNRIQS